MQGLVRLTAGRTLSDGFLIDRLGPFHERYPAVDLELIGEARIMSLARREADIALRFGTLKDSDLMARRLATVASASTRHRPTATSSRPGADRHSSASTRTLARSPRPPG